MKRSKILLFSSLILLLVGCGVKRNIVKKYSSVDATDYNDIIKISNTREQELKNIKATIGVRVSLKGKTVSSSAQFLCQKGNAIRIILVPFPFVEAARLWFTRQGVYIWDKLNSVQVFASYKDLSDRLGVRLSYDVLESIFLGEIFTKRLPEDDNIVTECLRNSQTLGYTLHGKTKAYTYTFLLNKSALVDSLSIHSTTDNSYLNYSISSFQEPQSNIYIPVNTSISIIKDNRRIFLMDIDWKRVKVNVIDNFPNLRVSIDDDIPVIGIDDVLDKLK